MQAVTREDIERTVIAMRRLAQVHNQPEQTVQYLQQEAEKWELFIEWMDLGCPGA